jgi:hypothetical protein
MLRELCIYKWPFENIESKCKYPNTPEQRMVEEKGNQGER